MKNKIKIYISCHKDCFLPNRSFLYPIQVGAKSAPERFPNILHDDEGDNISEKNPMYCELTAQYWAWKNDDADYFGFFHYRRYMNFSKKELDHNAFQDAELSFLNEKSLDLLDLNEDCVQKVVAQYDIIATTPVNLKKLNPPVVSNYIQYEITPYQHKEDLDVMLEIIQEKYPDYYKDAFDYLHSNFGYYCNMFIMKRDIFREYSTWLFHILEEHEKRRNYHNYDITGYRVSGYLGERLFGIWYNHQKKQGIYKYTELQRTLFQHIDKPVSLRPAYENNNVAIALAANNYFVPYTVTLLQSIIDSSSVANNYDILILTQDIQDENKKRIAHTISSHPNFSIRYADPSYLMGNYEFYVRGHFGLQTYYRLVLPDLIPNFKKIIYLDSDMIVKADLSELYKTDVNGYLVAACLDPDTAGLYNGYEKGKKAFMDQVMKLENPYSYFQAGTLLLNLEEFRKTYSLKYILDFAVSEKWQLLDQDILNCLCKNKVKYIDMSWNVMVDLGGFRIREIIGRAPQWLYKMYMEARKHPKIIHYAGPEKPWTSPEIDMGDIFWSYARKTSYYETMLYRMSHCVAHSYTFKTAKLLKFKHSMLRLKDFLFPYGTRRHAIVKRVFYFITKRSNIYS